MAHINSKLSLIFNHVIAVLSASIQSVEYSRSLSIKRYEWKRYLKKSISLALCYAGFAELGKTREAWLAGKAAFLCCAYDVVTDWRGFDPKDRCRFEKILHNIGVNSELRELTMGLYEKELFHQLEDDGLDRGAIALRFILRLMKCENAREIAWKNLDEVGQLLQIVDDVLDYEDDVAYGDTNCLTSEKRDVYLNRLLQKFGDNEVRKFFGYETSILLIAIGKARNKAKELLQIETIKLEKVKSINY